MGIVGNAVDKLEIKMCSSFIPKFSASSGSLYRASIHITCLEFTCT